MSMVRSAFKLAFATAMIMAGLAMASPVAADAAVMPDDSGYWLLGGDGGVFAFDTVFAGSAAVEFA